MYMAESAIKTGIEQAFLYLVDTNNINVASSQQRMKLKNYRRK